MAKSVKHSGAGAGNGGGMNEDDFNDMYGTKFLGPDDVEAHQNGHRHGWKRDLRPP